jgi:hypothetical protein
MPRNVDDVETFLYRLERQFQRDGDAFMVASGVAATPVVVLVNDPVLLVRVDIGHVPSDASRQVAVFRKLLELNGSDLVHGSYGLEGDEIVLAVGLQLENLDLNELGAALADIDLALARHVPVLRDLSTK